METNYNKPSTAGIAMKWGAITGLISIIYSTILQVTGMATNQGLSWLGFVILIGGIFYAMKDFKTQTGGYMTYGEGLGVGTLTSAISGLLSSAFAAFYIGFIDDSSIKQTLALQRKKFEEQGMDDAQIDQAIAMAEKFSGPGTIFLFGLIGSVIIGLIISLVIAAILKHERKELV
jgi:hypothetical protein